MRRCLAVALCLSTLAGCGRAHSGRRSRDAKADHAAIDSLTNRLAAAVSRRDAQGAAEGVTPDSSVVYISDGHMIRGFDYIRVLSEFYATVDSLEFRWTRKELSFPTPETAVLVGAVDIRWKKTDSAWVNAPAVVSSVYKRGEDGSWRTVIGHKTTIMPD